MPVLLAVDAPSLLYRAFHALPKSMDDRGQARQRAARHRQPGPPGRRAAHARAVVLASAPRPPLPRRAYPGYHADRPPMPDELEPQWSDAPRSSAPSAGRSCPRELEADDLLGALRRPRSRPAAMPALHRRPRHVPVRRQDVTVLYAGGKGERHGPAEVRKRYGIAPGQVPDFIALRGDPCDGMPGAKGIGRRPPPICSAARHARGRCSAQHRAAPARAQARGGRRTSCSPSGRWRRCSLRGRAAARRADRFGGAAEAARRSMNRLAERLDAWAAA